MSVSTSILPETCVAVIRFSNPPVNALSKATCRALHHAVAAAKKDARVRAILLIAGEGLPFSGGADIKEFDTSPSRSNEVGPLSLLIEEMEAATIPVVACIHNYAFGGGLELALACHYRVAMPDARLGLPEVKLGLIPGAGGTQRLPRLVGLEIALKMIVTGNPIPATAAHKSGLVDVLVGDGKGGDAALMQASLAFVCPKRGAAVPVRRAIDLQVPEFAASSSSSSTSSSTSPPLELCHSLAKKSGIKIDVPTRGGTAQHGCCEAIAAAALLDPQEGLRIETSIFNRLLQSEESKARRHVFFSERMVALNHHVDLAGSTPIMKHVGVVGGGTMGAGIAVAFLDAGVRVTLVEVQAEALARAHEVVQGIITSRVRRGQMTPGQAAALATSGRFHGTLSIQDLGECDMVVEAVYEDMALKKDIFMRLDSHCSPKTILATNTSTLSIDEIAKCTKREGRVIGMHFFSPAHLMKLVEVVKGAKTLPETIAAVAAVTKPMKKVCVVVGNCDGFVGNRMLFSYQKELQFMVEEGADPYRIDKLLFDFGFPVGPFVMSDIAGLDVALRIKQQRQRRLRQQNGSITRTAAVERETDVADKLCELTGRLGQKNGLGWYKYDPSIGKGRTPLPDPTVQTFLEKYRKTKGMEPRSPPHTDKEILERSLFPLLNEGIKILEEGIATNGGDIDIVWIYGYGFPAWRGGPMYYAEHHVGLPKLLAGLECYARQYPQSPHFKPANLLRELVRKSQGLVARL
ncbi:3-hydroxyacyl-dehydrogenase [Nannochloropsis oceanica]